MNNVEYNDRRRGGEGERVGEGEFEAARGRREEWDRTLIPHELNGSTRRKNNSPIT